MSKPELINSQRILIDNFHRKIDKSIWSTKRIEEDRLEFATIDGVSAVGIKVNHNDKRYKNTERSEVSEKSGIQIPVGVDIFYGFSIFLPSDFLNTKNRLVLVNWKEVTNPATNPFLSVRYVNGEMYAQINGDTSKEKFTISTNATNRWMNFNVGYKLLENGLGVCSMNVNGSEIIQYSGEMGYKNALDNKTYFKMGIYRDSINVSQTAYFANFRRGPTSQSISK